jgi:hypothetical protein
MSRGGGFNALQCFLLRMIFAQTLGVCRVENRYPLFRIMRERSENARRTFSAAKLVP